MANDLQLRQENLVNVLIKRSEDLRQLLPKGVTVEAFVRLTKNAILRDPHIAEADPQSVFLEVSKAAQDGLVLDGREAVLTRFKGRRQVDGKWEDITNVAYIPMIAGIKKRVMNSRVIKSWTIGLVYENEMKPDENGQPRFDYLAGDEPRIYHRPIILTDRGPVVAAYSSAKLADGSYHHEVMTVGQLRAIKNRTKSKKSDGTITGPWATDEEEMFRKTVARRHSKSLPMSAEDMAVISRVDDLYDFHGDPESIYDAEPEPEPQSVKNKRAGSAADKLKRAEKPKAQAEPSKPASEPEHDEDGVIEGEIMPPDDDGADERGPDDPF